MKKITGDFATREVRIGGAILDPARSQKLWNHSPDGFNWGYAGSGPAQLALAILLRAGLSNAAAVALHQQFKFDVIARLPQADFTMETGVVIEWISKHEHLIREAEER